ncbi:hypothetical protein LEP1GSC007_3739 [Leptospira interrogans serovar Bulgarica str. Mallika]|nr:hypothetical protein LEP1GSC007_3739 [Leptospira interrogans serovar Bulgarica str. Mallika]
MQENAEASTERSLPRGRVRGEDLAHRFNQNRIHSCGSAWELHPTSSLKAYGQRKMETFSMQEFFKN